MDMHAAKISTGRNFTSRRDEQNSSINLKPSTSCEALNPTVRNLLSLLDDTPVIEIRKSDTGRKDADEVYMELRRLSDKGFRVLEDSESMFIIRDGTARSFLI